MTLKDLFFCQFRVACGHDVNSGEVMAMWYKLYVRKGYNLSDYDQRLNKLWR